MQTLCRVHSPQVPQLVVMLHCNIVNFVANIKIKMKKTLHNIMMMLHLRDIHFYIHIVDVLGAVML